jgi:hypothetical protein
MIPIIKPQNCRPVLVKPSFRSSTI